MLYFHTIRKVDLEVLGLFRKCRSHFSKNSSKTVKKQLSSMIKESDLFFKVFYYNEFIGCIFLDYLYEDRPINIGGFSGRGTHTGNIKAVRYIADKYSKEFTCL